MLAEAGIGSATTLRNLHRAWTLQQNISQLLKVALEDDADPDSEPPALQTMLAKAGNAANYPQLRRKLISARGVAHRAFQSLV